MAETRQHARRLPEIEARDEQYMRMRRAGYASNDAARTLGLSNTIRQRVEGEYWAQYAPDPERPANDDRAHVAAVKSAGGFGRYVEVRTAEGERRLVYVPFALERRLSGARV